MKVVGKGVNIKVIIEEWDGWAFLNILRPVVASCQWKAGSMVN